MNKKFIKKNIFMIVFMVMALVGAVALLFMVLYEHGSMKEYDSKKAELLKKINKIIKQQYTPVKVNVVRMERDIVRYNKEVEKIRSKFGHPYAWAIKRFTEVVGVDINEFKAKFGEFWESQKGRTTRDLIFRRYKVRQFSEDFPKHRSTWENAMNAFMREAQKVTLEDIDSSNVDGIFLAAMGKGRRFSDSPARCQAFMKRMRIKMIEYFGNTRKVDCEEANKFSFDDDRLPLDGDIERIARAWEIVADLGKRIADAKVNPEEDVLRLTSFTKRGLDGEKDGNYTMYRFNFTVNGDLNTIRRIVKKLYEAYTENRVYAIRDIKLTRTVDGVKNILDESEKIDDELDYDTRDKEGKDEKQPPGAGTARLDKRQFGIPSGAEGASKTRASVKKKAVKKEKKKILGPKDRDYAKIIVGKRNICTAEFEVDYIVFDNLPK